MSLEALERSDLSRLPGGIFTRAFVRAYAQEVGLDPDRTIQDFIAEVPAESASSARASALEDGARLESDRKAVTTAIRLALFSAPLISLVIYYGGQRAPVAPATEPASVIESVPTAEPAPPPSPETSAPAPVESAPAIVPDATGLQMEIAPRASCWVSLTADGERVFSGMMTSGEKRAVTAREQILVNVGDAGAFAYTLNGRPGRQLGAPGEVVSRRITLSNLSEFISP
jgi:cytoskeletal protein RodZ